MLDQERNWMLEIPRIGKVKCCCCCVPAVIPPLLLWVCGVVVFDAVVYTYVSILFAPTTYCIWINCKLWNSELFNPVAPPSRCHSDFAMAIDCSYGQVVRLQPAKPPKIADCLASMRSYFLKIIPKWEQSGQGKGVKTTKKRNKEATTTTTNNNKMYKRMTHSVRRWHRSPAKTAGNRAASVLFQALMLWAFWVIGRLEHCSGEVPFLAEGHCTCCTIGRLWTPINSCNLHCSGSPVQLAQPLRQPRQVLWAVLAVGRLEAELMAGKTTNNKQAGWLRLLRAFTSSLQYMNAWLTNEKEIENNWRSWRITEHCWKRVYRNENVNLSGNLSWETRESTIRR